MIPEYPHLDFIELPIGPIVQTENAGVNIIAGYFTKTLDVFLRPIAIHRTKIA